MKSKSYSADTIKKMKMKKAKKQVAQLEMTLRQMNIDGIELYSKHSSYADGVDFDKYGKNKQKKYNEMFEKKYTDAKKKVGKCGTK